jgi:4,5-dihydroxyphthalate decarboxylase
VAVSLTFACGLYDRMVPLYAGQVRPEGIDLQFVAIDNPREIFDRMAGQQAFDAAEMSASEFISRKVAGQCPFVAIPAFPSRVFRHSFMFVNRQGSVKTPQDLAGKRIGLPLYTMTAALWIRGHLQHEYGVDLSSVRWVQGAINKGGAHGNPTVLPMARPPQQIENNTSGKSLSDLLEAGEIDAIIGTQVPDAMAHNADIVRLIPDFRAVEQDYFKRTGIFPIMHLVAIRRDVYERNPEVAASLYRALCASKDQALERMRYLGALRYMLPWLPDDLDELTRVFGADPWPYGVEANRPTLQALADYMVEQGIIGRPIAVNDIFVETRS